MKKEKIMIEEVISNLWSERSVCYEKNKVHQKLVDVRKNLLSTLDENQTKWFYEFEDVNALLEIETENELISYVLSFIRAFFEKLN